MTPPDDVLVVGAAAAGLTTAEALRRKGFTGRLTVLGAERHPPYDRPPLSKQVLAGTWAPDRTRLRAVSTLDAEFVLGDPAVSLDGRAVTTASGRVLSAEAVVLATGLRPRTLPGGAAGVHVLRTVDDAVALRASLTSASRVVVVGDGVLGAEITATVCALGVPVTMAGPQEAPLAMQVGPLVSGALAALHAANGVDLRLGSPVTGLVSSAGRVTGVTLADGSVLPADVVVVAFGAAPVTDWLTGSGLRLDDGVVCDTHCRAADGVYAVGDVARWHHAGLDTLLRLENRTNATEQAIAVAGTIMGEDRPYTPVPYYWTDQFDAHLHVHGTIPAGAEVSIVDGSVAENRFVARFSHAGRVTGVLGWNMPRQARQHRQSITWPASQPANSSGVRTPSSRTAV